MPQRKRKTANKKTRRAKAPEVSRVEGRYHMVEEAAYFKAEKEGFQGDPAHYWIAAEAEIDTMLTKKKEVMPKALEWLRQAPAILGPARSPT